MVLISPLWAIYRKGCASFHFGDVLVENRECTNAKAKTTRLSEMSGKYGFNWLLVNCPLYTMVFAEQVAM
jgi:hypothetical protein